MKSLKVFKVPPINLGAAKTCLEGNTHRHADVGNRVHTRNDSDEDVRGNTCNEAIAWKALPWSFIIQTFFLWQTQANLSHVSYTEIGCPISL